MKELLEKLTVWKKEYQEHSAKGHVILIECLEHAALSRDVSVFDHALQCVPHKHGPVLTKWLMEFSPIVPKDSTSFRIKKGTKEVAEKPFNVEGAKANPYYSFMPEKEVTEFDPEKWVRGVIAKAQKEKVQQIHLYKLAALLRAEGAFADVAEEKPAAEQPKADIPQIGGFVQTEAVAA